MDKLSAKSLSTQHYMSLITHHHIGININGKQRRQKQQTLFNPRSTMLIALAGKFIFTRTKTNDAHSEKHNGNKMYQLNWFGFCVAWAWA